MTKLLLDGDLFAYRSAAARENDDVQFAYHYMEELLETCMREAGGTSFQFYLSGINNFRNKVYPEYKGNRADIYRPRHLTATKDYLFNKYEAEICEGLEADDLMGIYQTAQTKEEPTIIVSLDKDMLQVPGWHYSWRIEGGAADKRWVKEACKQEITPQQGIKRFYTQLLTGDSTDNIKGVRGVGKMKAAAMLAAEELQEDDMFEIVRGCYGNDAEMLMNAECLWILRNYGEPFSKTKKGQELEASIREEQT